VNAMEAIIYAAFTLTGLTFSAVYSGLETGLYMLNPVRLTVRAAREDHAAVHVRNEFNRIDRLLTVLLLGNNGANYLGTYGLAALMAGLGLTDWEVVILQAVIVTPILFVFGETLPKELFRTHTDRWTYRLSPVLVLSRWVFTITLLLPSVQLVTRLVDRATGRQSTRAATARQRVSRMIKEGVGAGVLTESQTTLADRALALRDRTVGDVMVPWRQVVAIRLDTGREARDRLMRERNLSRLPVTDRRGQVVGVMSWDDAVLEAASPTRDVTRNALTFPPETRLMDAMSTMRHQREAIAIVVAPGSGRPIGLVTLKDLVEPLTGELTAW
jgi:putative hemolysin